MPSNPVLAYAAPGAPSQAMTLTLFSGASVIVRGVAGDAETSVGEVGAAWSQSGPAVWIAWGGDPKEIETVQYHDAQTDQRVVRRRRSPSASPEHWVGIQSASFCRF